MTESISGLREELSYTLFVLSELSRTGEVPLMNEELMLRGLSQVFSSGAEKSSQRGMVTAHNHCLYAVEQLSQFLTKEYLDVSVVSQGIISSEFEKFFQ